MTFVTRQKRAAPLGVVGIRVQGGQPFLRGGCALFSI